MHTQFLQGNEITDNAHPADRRVALEACLKAAAKRRQRARKGAQNKKQGQERSLAL